MDRFPAVPTDPPVQTLSYQRRAPVDLAIPSYFEIFCAWFCGVIIGCLATDIISTLTYGAYARIGAFEVCVCIFPITWLVTKLMNVRMSRPRLLWLAIGGPLVYALIITLTPIVDFVLPLRTL